MSELMLEILGGWVRAALIAASTYLIQHHIVTASQGDRLTGELFTHTMLAVPALAALAWTAVAKYKTRIKFLTALTVPPGSSEQRVEEKIANGAGASIKSSPI